MQNFLLPGTPPLSALADVALTRHDARGILLTARRETRVVDRSVSCRRLKHTVRTALTQAPSTSSPGAPPRGASPAGDAGRHESSQVQQQPPIGTAHRVIANGGVWSGSGGRRMLRPGGSRPAAMRFFSFLFHAFFPFSLERKGEEQSGPIGSGHRGLGRAVRRRRLLLLVLRKDDRGCLSTAASSPSRPRLLVLPLHSRRRRACPVADTNHHRSAGLLTCEESA